MAEVEFCQRIHPRRPRQHGELEAEVGVPVEGLLGQGEVTVLQQQLVPGQAGPLPLCPPVLIPSLDLGVRQIQFGGKLLSVLNREILLLFKTPLKGLELIVAECCASLSLFPL